MTGTTLDVRLGFAIWTIPTSAMGTADIYLKPVAVVGGEEQQLCHLLAVRPTVNPGPLTITSPAAGSTAVPRMPLLEWAAVPNAVVYRVTMSTNDTGDITQDYWAFTSGWRTSLRFNQTSGPGVITTHMLTPKAPNRWPATRSSW